MAKATVDTLASEVEKILAEYGEEIDAKMGEVVDKLAKKGVEALKSSSPVDPHAPKSGEYAKGWRVEKDGKKHRQLTHSSTIYNKHAGLVHLLEHGHALRQGGRSPARVHVKPVEDTLFDSFRPEELTK